MVIASSLMAENKEYTHMDFEKVLGLVGDNPEAKAELNVIKSEVEVIVTARDSYKSQFEKVKTEKDNYKKGNQLVKKMLGVERVDEEAIKEKLETLSDNSDQTKKLQDLAQQVQAKDEAIEAVKSEYAGKMDSFQVDMEISKALDANSKLLADDPLLRDSFKQIVSGQIGKIGDTVVPYTVIGDVKTPLASDGKAVSVADFVAQTLNDDKFQSFRKSTVTQGAGTAGTGGTPPNKNTDKPLSQMTFDERLAIAETQG